MSSAAIAVGTELGPVEKSFNLRLMEDFSHTLGASNPIHFDPEFAARTRFGGPIASGPITLTLIDELMGGAFPREWLRTGAVKVTFIAPVRPGDSVSLKGRVESIESQEAGQRLTVQLDCTNQNGQTILVGTAEVTVGAASEPTADRQR